MANQTEKYKLWGGGKTHDNQKVFRIQALADFNDVKKGELGGYVASEENLTNNLDDHSWVYDDSVVQGDGRVEKNSFVDGQSVVKGSRITNGSSISHGSVIEHSRIDGSSIQNSQTFYANVLDSDVSHEVEVRNARVEGSELGNGAKVSHSTMINSSLVNDAAIAKGAHLTNVHLDDEIIDRQKVVDYSTSRKLDLLLSDEDLVGLEDENGLQF